MKTDFKEEQKFTQLWLWLILIGTGIFPVIGIYKQLILGEKFGNKPMSDLGLILFAASIFGLIAQSGARSQRVPNLSYIHNS